MAKKRININLAWLPRVMPVIGPIIGWVIAGWLGALVGLLSGCVAWPVLWVALTFYFMRLSLKRQRQRVAKLSTEELRQITTNPASRDMGFAIMELDRRGVEPPLPSLESLSALLTSQDSNRRGLGMSMLFALYPSIKQTGWSNMDPPEVWRERIASLRNESHEPLQLPRPPDTPVSDLSQ
jgi:hypothetical protein